MELGEGGQVGEVHRKAAGEVVGLEAQDLEVREAAESVGRDRAAEADPRKADADDAGAVRVAGDAFPATADGDDQAPIEAAAVGDGGDEIEQRLSVLHQTASIGSGGEGR